MQVEFVYDKAVIATLENAVPHEIPMVTAEVVIEDVTYVVYEVRRHLRKLERVEIFASHLNLPDAYDTIFVVCLK